MKVAMRTPPPPSQAPQSRQSTIQWDFVDDKHDDGEVKNDNGDDKEENDDDENDDDENDDDNENDSEGFTPVIGNSTRKRRLLINNVNNNRSRNNSK